MMKKYTHAVLKTVFEADFKVTGMLHVQHCAQIVFIRLNMQIQTPKSESVASPHVPTNESQTCNIYLYYYTPLLCPPQANALLMIFNDVALVHGKHLCQALSTFPCISLESFFFLFPDTRCVVMRIVFIHCTLSRRKVPAGIKGGAMGGSAHSYIQEKQSEW